jgi:hypothetical protein
MRNRQGGRDPNRARFTSPAESALLILILACSGAQAKVNLAGVAAATTVAVNVGTMAKLIRHPKRSAKETGAKIKAAVKGKN